MSKMLKISLYKHALSDKVKTAISTGSLLAMKLHVMNKLVISHFCFIKMTPDKFYSIEQCRFVFITEYHFHSIIHTPMIVGPVSWGYRIYQLQLCRRVIFPQ